MLIEMLDEYRAVIEVCEVHVCTGEDGECEYPAICEDDDCGRIADPEHPVYCWTSGDEISGELSYFVCGPCIAADDYCRLAS